MNKYKKMLSDLPWYRRIQARIVGFLEDKALKLSNVQLYMDISALHYKIFYGRDLVQDNASGNPRAVLAAKRHARMIVRKFHQDADVKDKRSIYYAAKKSFMLNLLLEVELKDISELNL